MVKFADKYDKVVKLIQDENIVTGCDNLLGLMYLDGMVNIITQTPELREHLHGVIQGLMQNLMDVEMGPDNTEFEIAYS